MQLVFGTSFIKAEHFVDKRKNGKTKRTELTTQRIAAIQQKRFAQQHQVSMRRCGDKCEFEGDENKSSRLTSANTRIHPNLKTKRTKTECIWWAFVVEPESVCYPTMAKMVINAKYTTKGAHTSKQTAHTRSLVQSSERKNGRMNRKNRTPWRALIQRTLCAAYVLASQVSRTWYR